MATAHVLVVYGSTRHGTEGIAEAVAATLRHRGLDVDLQPANEPGDIAGYDAVVIGGALYAMRWHRDARRFARRHRAELQDRDVWLFSSGPLDESAEQKEIPPVRGVAKLMRTLHARGHETFGGRLDAQAPGFIARKMAEGGAAGDFRNFDHVNAWANGIADSLGAPPTTRFAEGKQASKTSGASG
jgi:menaquinone-dependent protoporphyrinogen oxidase